MQSLVLFSDIHRVDMGQPGSRRAGFPIWIAPLVQRSSG